MREYFGMFLVLAAFILFALFQIRKLRKELKKAKLYQKLISLETKIKQIEYDGSVYPFKAIHNYLSSTTEIVDAVGIGFNLENLVVIEFSKNEKIYISKKAKFVNALIRELNQANRNIGEVVIDKVEVINEIVKFKHPVLYSLSKLNDIFIKMGLLIMKAIEDLNKYQESFNAGKNKGIVKNILNVLMTNEKILGLSKECSSQL